MGSTLPSFTPRITADTFPDLSSTLTLFALCPLGEDVRKTCVLHRHLEAVGSVRLEFAENEVIQTHEADLDAAGDVVHEVHSYQMWLQLLVKFKR